MKRKQMTTRINGQEGVMLLEALIGILIFSIGILALVAMQANAISNVANAQYRSEAAALADEILGQILMDRGPDNTLATVDSYIYSGGTGGYPPLSRWVTKVNRLPGSSTYPSSIAVTTIASPGTNGPTKQVVVTVRWRAPTATLTSNHVAVGYISGS